MSKKLYVGGLSWSTSEETLYNTFEQYGKLDEVKIITDRETGRSRGFAFVTFANDADAMKAISGLNDKELDGRNLSVNEAREREDRGAGGGRSGYGGGGGGGRGGYGGGGGGNRGGYGDGGGGGGGGRGGYGDGGGGRGGRGGDRW